MEKVEATQQSFQTLYGEPLLSSLNKNIEPRSQEHLSLDKDKIFSSPNPLEREIPTSQVFVQASISDGTGESYREEASGRSEPSDGSEADKVYQDSIASYFSNNFKFPVRETNQKRKNEQMNENIQYDFPEFKSVETYENKSNRESGEDYHRIESQGDPILHSWSRELYHVSSFPKIVNFPSSISFTEGIKNMFQLSGSSMVYAIFGALPSFLALVCILFSGRPNVLNELAGFSLGVSSANLLWGIGLSLAGGMDLKSTEAVIDETWHICWKLLIKCTCVSFWFLILTLGSLLMAERFFGFPTTFFMALLEDQYAADIATSTLYIYSVGFLFNYFFECFHRFLSYHSCSSPQIIFVFSSSFLHSILLIIIVWRKPGGPQAAAIINSFIASIRALSLALYVYSKRYELGWQSGVRVRLFRRERKSIGKERRSTSSREIPDDTSEAPLRRQKRVATRRPGDASAVLTALQQNGSVDTGKGRSESLHPISAAVYAMEKETEKLKSLEKEAQTWYQSGSINSLRTSNGKIDSLWDQEGTTSVFIPSPERKNDSTEESEFTRIVVPRTVEPQPDHGFKSPSYASSSVTSQEMKRTSSDVVDETPKSFSQFYDYNGGNQEERLCIATSPQKSSLRSSEKGKNLQSKGKRQSAGFVEFDESSSPPQSQMPSLFNARRLSKKIASGSTFDVDSKVSEQGELVSGLMRRNKENEEVNNEASLIAPRRKRIRQKTFVSVRSVSVDNYLVLDGWCLPTTWSWRIFWNVQQPRQLRETIEFLKIAIPTAFLLSFEYLTFDLLVIIGGTLGPSSLVILSLIFSLNNVLSAVALAVSACVSEQIHFLIRLDNLTTARTLLRISARLILCCCGIYAVILIATDIYFGSLFSRSATPELQLLNDFPYSLILLSLISVADSLSILITTVLRSIGFLISSLVIAGILFVVIMPLSICIGIFVFHFSVKGFLLIVFSHVVIQFIVSLSLLCISSPLFSEKVIPEDCYCPNFNLPYLSLKILRRGPIECRILFTSLIHLQSSTAENKFQSSTFDIREELLKEGTYEGDEE